MAKNQDKIPVVENLNLVDLVVLGMDEMKAESISVIDLRKIKNAVADYFVICSGTSDSHVDAIADSIEKEVHKASGQNPWRKEGKLSREWILLDYVDIVAHVFKREQRKLYALEELWGDGIVTQINKLPPAVKALFVKEEPAPKSANKKKIAAKEIEEIPTPKKVVKKKAETEIEEISISKKPVAKKAVSTKDVAETKKAVAKKPAIKKAARAEKSAESKTVAAKKPATKKVTKKE